MPMMSREALRQNPISPTLGPISLILQHGRLSCGLLRVWGAGPLLVLFLLIHYRFAVTSHQGRWRRGKW